jgi:hypothetical protein
MSIFDPQAIPDYRSFPPAFWWEQYNRALDPRPAEFCGVKYSSFVISSSALNSVEDIIISALPVAVVWKLHLKRSHKYALMLVFATGAL